MYCAAFLFAFIISFVPETKYAAVTTDGGRDKAQPLLIESLFVFEDDDNNYNNYRNDYCHYNNGNYRDLSAAA